MANGWAIADATRTGDSLHRALQQFIRVTSECNQHAAALPRRPTFRKPRRQAVFYRRAAYSTLSHTVPRKVFTFLATTPTILKKPVILDKTVSDSTAMNDRDELQVFQQMIMSFDTPAYIRRARDTEAAWNSAISQCRRQRDTWLQIPKTRLALLYRAADGNFHNCSFLADHHRADLKRLHEEWQPELKSKASPAFNPLTARKEARALADAFARFNTRWTVFLDEFDLTEVNRKRQGYNEYYVLEKECVVLSARVARIGFQPLAPATTDELREIFPLLPEIVIA